MAILQNSTSATKFNAVHFRNSIFVRSPIHVNYVTLINPAYAMCTVTQTLHSLSFFAISA